MCSAGISVSTAFLLTFEELIVIEIFCSVILENEFNSIIQCYFVIAGKLYFPTLVGKLLVFNICGRERREKKKNKQKENKTKHNTTTTFYSSTENRNRAIRFAGMSSIKHPRNTRGKIIRGGLENSKKNLDFLYVKY